MTKQDAPNDKQGWIDYFRNRSTDIASAASMMTGTVTKERVVLNNLGYFNRRELVFVDEIGKGNKNYQIKYFKSESEYVLITYSLTKGQTVVTETLYINSN